MERFIKNAKDSRAGRLPQVGGALVGWQSSMTFKLVRETIVDREIVKTETNYIYQGVFQPQRSRDLLIKPEGERNWKWWLLHTKTKYDINNGDNIVDYKGRKFRVMKSNDWGQAGFYSYELVESFTEA